MYSHSGLLHNDENEQATTVCNNIDEFHKHSAEPEKGKQGTPYASVEIEHENTMLEVSMVVTPRGR